MGSGRSGEWVPTPHSPGGETAIVSSSPIPPHILVTNLRPDLFIVSETKSTALVFELTCPWDSNIQRSHDFKEGKYAPLVADLLQHFTVYHFSVEVSVRGQISKENLFFVVARTLVNW